MATFNLVEVTEVQGEGRKEEAFTYVSVDGKQTAQFRAHSTKAFVYVMLKSTNVSKREFTDLVEAYTKAGLDQHKFEGGFDEAIKSLTI